MIRVLHTIDTTGPGGAETVFINLIKGLDQKRFQSIAVIWGPGWVCDTLQKNGIEPIFVPSKGSFNTQYLLALIRIIRQHKINIIQSHLLGSNLYSSLAGLICRVPVISTFHGFVDTADKERLMGLKSRFINLGSGRIVFVSDRLLDHYVHRLGFSAQKSVTIHNGVDTSVFFPKKDDSIRVELGIGPEHVLIGAIGNIRPAKGYDVFLKSARRIHDMNPNCRFLLAGQGSGRLYDKLLNLRKELNLEDVFFFAGFRADVSKVLNNLDIFVLPSVSEGFSISTIEAMACGVPVVVTRSGGPEEIVTEDTNGLLVPCDPELIAGAAGRLLNNLDLKQKIIDNASKKLNDKFSLGSMTQSYQALYDTLS